MNREPRNVHTSAFGAPQGPNVPEYPYTSEGGFPGGGYGGGGPSYPVPFQQSTPTSSKPFGSGFNLNELKGMLDRMGGIEGVLNMMNKANKFMQTMQQFAPMVKLFMGSFGGKASTADSFNDDYYPPRRRRRRRKRRSGSSGSGRPRQQYSKKRKGSASRGRRGTSRVKSGAGTQRRRR